MALVPQQEFEKWHQAAPGRRLYWWRPLLHFPVRPRNSTSSDRMPV